MAGTEIADRSPVTTQAPSSLIKAPWSISIEIICSTNSGLPSDASEIRSRMLGATPASPRIETISRSACAEFSGSSSISVRAPSLSLQPGRASVSSGRARQSSTIGTPDANFVRYSSSSSSVGSAQWTSSNTATSGRSVARLSKSIRTAQKASSEPDLASVRPMSWATRSATPGSQSGRSLAASFAPATSELSLSSIPATCLTISFSGQNVTPSP